MDCAIFHPGFKNQKLLTKYLWTGGNNTASQPTTPGEMAESPATGKLTALLGINGIFEVLSKLQATILESYTLINHKEACVSTLWKHYTLQAPRGCTPKKLF